MVVGQVRPLVENRGQVLLSNHDGSVLCLASLVKPLASSESQVRGRYFLEILIAGLFDVRSNRRWFFEVQRHILVVLRTPLVTPKATPDIVGYESPWLTVDVIGRVKGSTSGTWCLLHC